MSKEWYYINDIDNFVNSARKLVFKFFGNEEDKLSEAIDLSLDKLTKEETEELEETLSFNESLSIVKLYAKKQINKNKKTSRYCINDKILHQIIEALNSRLVSNILTKLTNQGVLESAYDSEINDFVFWIKEQSEDDTNNSN
jgi:hypothetical protein